MEQPTVDSHYKLIHVGFIFKIPEGSRCLFLRKKAEGHYAWFECLDDGSEAETDVFASTVEEAIRLGRFRWRRQAFRTLNCGFRYTLPERDEHGMNALFHQMVASYSASSGIYFDDELGHNCIIHAASSQAREYWKKLSQENKL